MNTSIPGASAALISALTWAMASSVYSRTALRYPPFVVNGTRTLIGSLIFFPLMLLRPEGLAQLQAVPNLNILWLICAAFCSFALGDALFFKASHRLGVSTALTIASGYPVLSALASTLYLSETLAWTGWAGVVTVVTGVMMVLRSDRNTSNAYNPSEGKLGGYLYVTGATCCWAFLSIAINRASQGAVEPLTLSFIRQFIAFFICTGVGFLMERTVRSPVLPTVELRKILPLCLIETGVGGFAFTYAYQNSSLPVAATLTSVYPTFAFLLAVAAGRESFSTLKLTGTLLILSGIWFIVAT